MKDGNNLYFMDCENDYRIAKVDLTNGEKTLVTDCRVDEFELVALGTSFTNSKAELPSQKLLKQLYMKFLQEQCERHLRLNTPIRLTPEIINRYGLTKWDAGKIRPYINRFNRKAKTKIRAEFDKLAALDFIREELEKSGTK